MVSQPQTPKALEMVGTDEAQGQQVLFVVKPDS